MLCFYGLLCRKLYFQSKFGKPNTVHNGLQTKETQELIKINDCAITRSGRVSKTINRDTNQNCVMYFAKMKKCRDKKKKQKKNSQYYSKKVKSQSKQNNSTVSTPSAKDVRKVQKKNKLRVVIDFLF